MLRVTALGIGHGDAILVEWAPEGAPTAWRCLIDGGESPPKLQERLAAHEVAGLDLLVLSHLDTDHAGGLIGLADRIPVKAYWGPCLPAFERHLWLFGERGVDALRRGRRLEERLGGGGVEILYPLEGFASAPLGAEGPILHVLSPPARLLSRLLLGQDVLELIETVPTPLGWLVTTEGEAVGGDFAGLRLGLARGALAPGEIPEQLARPLPARASSADLARAWAARTGQGPEFFGDSLLNNTSLVVWIEARTGARLQRALLPGDQENWTYLFARHPRGLQAEILKLSHHGGRVYLEAAAAHEELFSMVRPEAVLVSANGRHGLPRSVVRQAAIRWNATVFCTSRRGREIVLGLVEEEKPCCHEQFCCEGNEDVTVSLTARGIESSKLACHSRQGGQPGPVIEIRQLVVEPSHVVHELFEGELRAHLAWVRERLQSIHRQRRAAALPEARRSEPVTLAELGRLAAAAGRSDLALALSRVLEEGNRRQRFWAARASYGEDSWRAYAWPPPPEVDEYRELVKRKVLLLFPAKDRSHPGDRDTLVAGLDPSGVALLAEEALAYPHETFPETLWPDTVRKLRAPREWHCFVMGDIGFGLSRTAADARGLLAALVDAYGALSQQGYLLPSNYIRSTDPILVSASSGGRALDHYDCRRSVTGIFIIGRSDVDEKEWERLKVLGTIHRSGGWGYDYGNRDLSPYLNQVSGEELDFLMGLLARKITVLW